MEEEGGRQEGGLGSWHFRPFLAPPAALCSLSPRNPSVPLLPLSSLRGNSSPGLHQVGLGPSSLAVPPDHLPGSPHAPHALLVQAQLGAPPAHPPMGAPFPSGLQGILEAAVPLPMPPPWPVAPPPSPLVPHRGSETLLSASPQLPFPGQGCTERTGLLGSPLAVRSPWRMNPSSSSRPEFASWAPRGSGVGLAQGGVYLAH